MSFKYRLNKENELGTKKDIRRFPSLSPDMLDKIGKLVDFDARKEFVITPANTPRSEELENIIRYSLDEENFAPEDIDAYMEFLYIERNKNVGGEFSDTPLNENYSKLKEAIVKYLKEKRNKTRF